MLPNGSWSQDTRMSILAFLSLVRLATATRANRMLVEELDGKR